ncbi:ABC transporter permease [Clostridium estertheticum]|uniref:ABC transporter permease n=1 Tax=Clostridium estertheticum TaxID=238834 RepID=UPI001C0C692C|nr:ABC transporter permease [Clostridium estertheticum]MBU3172376.1 ABC transporter permease [Clostridium estertheticum]
MEFSIRRVNALFKKEIKDLGKNTNVLIMFMFPIIFCIIYSNLLGENISRVQVLTMCVDLNLTLISSFVIAMLIAEEKEKNTLRTLMLSAVSPLEFFTGKVLITFVTSEIINVAMFFIVSIDAKYVGKYILLTTLVVFIMIGIGAIIGLIAPNQMATGVVGMPVIMIFYMIPMFAGINKALTKTAEFLPNYNMNLMLKMVFKGEAIGIESVYSLAVILVWIIIIGAAFACTYNKIGIDK